MAPSATAPFLREDWEAQNVSVVARCRKDIVLCRRKAGKGPGSMAQLSSPPNRFADATPGQVAGPNLSRRLLSPGPLQRSDPIYWQGGARKRPVRLLVVAPMGYRTGKNGRKYYRQPAYLLTTDLKTDARVLLQAT